MISATPDMLKMKKVPIFVVGGVGRFSIEDKDATIQEYLNHLRVYVTGTAKVEDIPEPKFSASLKATVP